MARVITRDVSFGQIVNKHLTVVLSPRVISGVHLSRYVARRRNKAPPVVETNIPEDKRPHIKE